MSRSGEKKWKREWKWLKKEPIVSTNGEKKEGKKQQQKTNQNDSEL